MGRPFFHIPILDPRRAARLALASAAVLVAGCSGSGPLSRRMTTIGALKTDVAQLESEKDQNRRDLAEAQAENRRLSSQLAEAEDENNELASRLDDARNVIARQGGNTDKLAPASRSASDSDRPNARKATPAGSRNKNRKTPMAEIPRERRPLTDREDLPLDRAIEAPGPEGRGFDDPGPQGRGPEVSPWLPVARGGSESARTRQ